MGGGHRRPYDALCTLGLKWTAQMRAEGSADLSPSIGRRTFDADAPDHPDLARFFGSLLEGDDEDSPFAPIRERYVDELDDAIDINDYHPHETEEDSEAYEALVASRTSMFCDDPRGRINYLTLCEAFRRRSLILDGINTLYPYLEDGIGPALAIDLHDDPITGAHTSHAAQMCELVLDGPRMDHWRLGLEGCDTSALEFWSGVRASGMNIDWYRLNKIIAPAGRKTRQEP